MNLKRWKLRFPAFFSMRRFPGGGKRKEADEARKKD